VVGFSRGWKLTLVIAATTPLVAAAGATLMIVMANMTTRGQAAYAKAGAYASEILAGVRTVASFGAEQRSIDRYSELLGPATKIGEKRNFFSGLALGLVFFIFYCTYALALWYGAKLTVEEDYTGGKTLQVFFSVIMGSFALGQFGQTAEAIAKGQGSGYKLFEIIERKSKIDSSDESGRKLERVEGDIEFRVI
jgi:ATP-binding cassette subfamily B (MDR/TAP) protein 1